MKVIYHANCVDGFTAAWCAWLKYGDVGVEYIPAQYGDPPPSNIEGQDVLIVDFSYPRDVLLRMRDDATSFFRVFDHHKTAEADLKGLDFCVFDMERSGAGLTWDLLWGNPRPLLVDYVEDRDLWRFKLNYSKEINACIGSYPYDFETWSILSTSDLDDLITQGKAVLRAMDKHIATQLPLASLEYFAGYKDIPVLNCTYAISETIGALSEGHPFAVGWFQRANGQYVYSLRSRSDFDVSEVAKKFGGGGHKNAAGFTVRHRERLGLL